MISIIVPVYNANKYINRVVESILKQTYSNFEVLLIDDGSTDCSLRMCRDWAKKDSRIKVFSKKNEGLGKTRNFGLLHAHGEFVMFIDSDDWIEQNCLADTYKLITDENAQMVLFSYYREFKNQSILNKIFTQSENELTGNIKDKTFGLMIGPVAEELNCPAKINDLATAWGKLYSRQSIGETRFSTKEEVGYSEDLWFNLQVVYKCKKVVYCPTVSYHYDKENESSLVHKFDENVISGRKKLFEKIRVFLQNNVDETCMYERLDNRMAISVFELVGNIAKANMSFKWKLAKMGSCLRDDQFHSKIEELDIGNMPIVWQVFFLLAKSQRSLFVYMMVTVGEHFKKVLK